MRNVLSALLLTSSLLRADGGITLGQIERDGLRVTVFAAPVPVLAGPLDVTFLVQELPSNQPVTDASIACLVQRLSPPSLNVARLPAWCSTIAAGARIQATLTHSRNKLLLGAYLPLTEAGRWELRFDISRAQTRFTAGIPFDVAPPRAPVSTWWPLIALVPAAILLYVWRSVLVRSKRRIGRSPRRSSALSVRR
ncbi:MAG: hypothetical protein WCO94_01435 [Verrucomicrobiota bacterium]